MNSFTLSGEIAHDGAVTFRHGYRDEKTGSPTSLQTGFGDVKVNDSGEIVGRLNLGTPELVVMSLSFVLTKDL